MKDKPVVYVFVGDGLGVPGLPHKMTQEQADAQGVGKQLAECIAAGVYVETEWLTVPPGFPEGETFKIEIGQSGRKVKGK